MAPNPVRASGVLPSPMLRLLFCLLLPLALGLGSRAASIPFPHSIVAVDTGSTPVPTGRHSFGHLVRSALSTGESAAPMEFSLVLKLHNQAELEARVARGEILTADQLAAYLPTADDYRKLRAWLQKEGFTISLESGYRHALFARGSVTQVARSLQVSMARIKTGDGEFTSAISAPSLPEEIASPVAGIRGLQPHLTRHPHSPSGQQLVSNDYLAVTPAAIASTYQAPTNLTGAGQTIAIIGDAVVSSDDVTSFWAECGIRQSWSNITQVNVGAGAAGSTTNAFEMSMDVEWSSGIAPGATIRVYEAPSPLNSNTEAAAYTQILNDLPNNPNLHQVTESYGGIEAGDELTYGDSSLLLLAAQGVSCFAAAGDGGSNPDPTPAVNAYKSSAALATSYPSTDPFMTAVGGTTLTFLTAQGGAATGPEIAWSVSGSASNGTGGGYSAVFSRPSWQSATGLAGGTARAIPDVAALADTGTAADDMVPLVIEGQTAYGGGGTSLSSPIWAGLCALINQSRRAASLPPVGFLNAKLYPLAGTTAFTDITSGNNGAYSAGTGYDLCTGLGTPRIGNLITALAGPTPANIITNPSSVTVNAGASARFTVIATGNPDPVYQWQVQVAANGSWTALADDATYQGSTTDTLTVAITVPAMDGYQYRCTVSNSGAMVNTSAATLGVRPSLPVFIQRPYSKIATVGGQVSFSAVVADATVYQWKHNGQVVSGVTGNSLNLSLLTLADDGNYEVDAINARGTVASYFQLHGNPDHLGLVVWGADDFGQTSVPTSVGSVFSADIGPAYLVALRLDGTIVTWGQPSAVALVPSGLSNVVAVSLQGSAGLAVKADGTVVCWGTTATGTPTAPAGLTQVVAAAMGGSHCVALRADGTVVTWGDNSWGQCTVPTGLANVVAVDAGSSHSIALKADGTLVTWGQNTNYPSVSPPANLSEVVAIRAGGFHNLGLKRDGSVVAWGFDYNGQVSGMNGQSGIARIAAADSNSLGLSNDGQIIVAGNLFRNGLNPVPQGISGVTDIAVGYGNAAALLPALFYFTAQPASQTINLGANALFSVGVTGIGPFSYQWRHNGVNLSDSGNVTGSQTAALTIKGVAASDAGSYDVLVTNASGTQTSGSANLSAVAAPVTNSFNSTQTVQVGSAVTFQVSASGSGLSYAWKHNGTVVAGATSASFNLASAQVADSGFYEVVVTNPSGGTTSTYNLLSVVPANNTVIAWGNNDYGQTNLPSGLKNVVALAAANHSLAVTADGKVVAWGDNTYGQTNTPADLANVVAVACGSMHSVALKADGKVVAWGDNSFGQSSVPAGLSNVIAVAASYSYTLALKSDGTLVQWGGSGYNSTPQLPAGLSNCVGIAAGSTFAYALKSDGTVTGWGSNWYGETPVPAGLKRSVAVVAGGGTFGAALAYDGTVSAWGGSSGTIRQVPSSAQGLVQLSAGGGQIAGLTGSGQFVAWGDDNHGETNPPWNLGSAYAVVCGGAFNLAIVPLAPPAIDQQPLGKAALTGDSVTIQVQASGQAPLQFQWRRNGVPLQDSPAIAGTSTDTLTLSNLNTSSAGAYDVLVTTAGGSVTSQVATLSVAARNGAPHIDQAPQATAVLLGQNAMFSVGASGSAPLTYQWYQGQSGDTSKPMAGWTSTNFVAQTPSSCAYYWVRVTNSAGTADSAAAPALLWSQASTVLGSTYLSGACYANGTYFVGGNGTLAYSADGANWNTTNMFMAGGYKLNIAYGQGVYAASGGSTTASSMYSSDGLNWSWATTPFSSNITEAMLFDGTNFVCLSNGGVATSPDAKSWTLRTRLYLDVLAQGGGRYVAASTYNSNYAVSTDGVLWQMIPAPTTARPSALTYGRGRFVLFATTNTQLQILSSADGVHWHPCAVPLMPDGSAIQPNPLSLAYGSGVFLGVIGKHFLVSTDGDNWSLVPYFITGSTEFGENLAYGNGRFLFAGGLSNAMLSALLPDAVSIYSQTNDTTVSSGQTSTLSVVASGSGLTYQWFTGASGDTSSPIAGATSATLTITPSQNTNYWVQVTNSNGSVNSTTIHVTLAVAPTITVEPGDVDAPAGSPVVLTVQATGTPTPAYQWYAGPSGDTTHPVNGAVASTLQLNTPSLISTYWVKVSNPAGAQNSSTSTITPWFDRSINGLAGLLQFAGGNYLMPKSGQWLASANGVTWSNLGSSVPQLGRLASNGTLYVGAGSLNGATGIYSSTDLVSWTASGLPAGNLPTTMGAMAYGANRFVIGATTPGTVLLSSDGTNWTTGPLAATESQVEILSVAFANGRFVAVGQEGPNSMAALVTSSDGSSWTRCSYPHPLPDGWTSPTLTPLGNVSYAGSLWFAMTEYGTCLMTSPDGITWTQVQLPINGSGQPLGGIVWTGSKFVLGTTGNDIYTSNDGVSWAVTSGPGNLKTASLDYRNGLLVAAGQNSIFTSADGSNWTPRISAPAGSSPLGGACFGNGELFLSGFWDDDWYSFDGSIWNKTATSVGQQAAGRAAWGSGKFICADTDLPGTYWSSTDGSHWSQGQVAGFSGTIQDVGYTNGLFFVLGANGQFASSADGSSWSMGNAGVSTSLSHIVFGNGLYALSAGWVTLASPDLKSWTTSATLPNYVAGIAFGRGRFVAAASGNSGMIMTSTDAVTWTQSYSDANNGLYDVIFDGARFVVSASDKLLFSPDGANWTAGNMPSTIMVTSGGGTILAIGAKLWQTGLPQGSPVITQQPAPASTLVGCGTSFAVNCGLNGTNTYQWQMLAAGASAWGNLSDGADYRGSAGPVLGVLAPGLGLNGSQFRCVIVNENGKTNSLPASLTVSATLPVFTTQPQSASARPGDSVSFTAVPRAFPAATLQWYSRPAGGSTWSALTAGSGFSGVSSQTLTISPIAATHLGTSYMCQASNLMGTIASAVATLSLRKQNQTISFANPGAHAFGFSAITLSASADSGLPVTFSVVSGSATINGTSLSFTGTGPVTIRASQEGNDTYMAASPVDQTFAVTADFDSWRLARFSTAELANPAISGATADPDGDGLTNLMEYALGTDPKAATTDSFASLSTDSGNWVYQFRRPTDRPDLMYSVQYSVDLNSWSSSGITLTLVSSANGTDVWSATLSQASLPTVFFRLSVSQ